MSTIKEIQLGDTIFSLGVNAENIDGQITDVPVKSVNNKTGNVVLMPEDLGLGTVFTLKGSKQDIEDLPSENNTIGDVWYIISKQVGYIWLNDGTTERWEQLGLPIDLSNYTLKSETGNLEELSTEDKTNLVNAINEIASSGGDTNNLKIFPIIINFPYSSFNRTEDTEIMQKLSDFLNYCVENNGNAMLSFRFTDDLQLFRLTTNVSSSVTYLYGLKEKVSGGLLKLPRLTIDKTIVDGKYKATMIRNDLIDSNYAYPSNYLAKNNTTAYTPSSQYHPATKGYVDTAIESAITTTLGGEF